jgi:serine/threonine protein kinase
LKEDSRNNVFGFSLSHDNKSVKTRTFYHRNQDAIQDWMRHIRSQANNLSFEAKYNKGKKLGNGKFATVYQCLNKDTGAIVAMKQIDKTSLSERERDFLREENQITKLISHKNIVQMRESYETEQYLHIIMEQVTGGELFEHIKTYELEEREVAIIMYQLIEAI